MADGRGDRALVRSDTDRRWGDIAAPNCFEAGAAENFPTISQLEKGTFQA